MKIIKIIAETIESLKAQGYIENVDFRVVYFNEFAEIKLIKNR